MNFDKNPLVSVIIAVKNGESTIKRSIDSVLQQSYENIELIVAINGCTDSTESIVKSFDDDRLIAINTEPGKVPARNAALKICNGDFIAIQDADDCWYKNKLLNQMNVMLSNKDIDILGTQMLFVDKDDKKYLTNYPLTDDKCREWMLRGMNPIANPSVVFRKEVLNKVGGYWDFFPYAEDMDFWYRCMPHFKFANLETTEMLYSYDSKSEHSSKTPVTMAAWYGKIFEIFNLK